MVSPLNRLFLYLVFHPSLAVFSVLTSPLHFCLPAPLLLSILLFAIEFNLRTIEYLSRLEFHLECAIVSIFLVFFFILLLFPFPLFFSLVFSFFLFLSSMIHKSSGR